MREITASTVVKRLGGTRQGIDEDARTATFVFSTSDTDRMGDIIDQKTWQLENYQKNPTFLWGHKSRDLPIGKTVDLSIRGNKLVGTVQFAGGDEYPFADTCWKLVKGGYLNAVSVGFRPHRWESYSDDAKGVSGYKFFDCELLECSLVPIPANQNALLGSKSLDGIEDAYRSLLADMQEGDEDVFAKADIEMIVKAFGAGTNPDPVAKIPDDMDGREVYDDSGKFMGLMVGGALKMARSYQDELRNRNAVLISEQAAAKTVATIEEKTTPTVSRNFFLRRQAARALARRTLLDL